MTLWDKEHQGRRDRWLSGIWASVPTPFDATGELDPAGLSANVTHYSSVLQLTGIYCNGIMGEGWSLTLEERMQTAEITVSAAFDASLRVGVVVTAGSLTETIRLARHAEEVGADHIIISPPPGDYDAVAIHRYVRTIRESSSLPIVIVEASSGGFGIATLQHLASRPTLVSAIKVGSTRDQVSELLSRNGEDVVITDPCECNWLANLVEFDMDVLYADPEPYLFQNANWLPIQSYYNAFLAKDVDAATRISESLRSIRALYDRMIMQPLRAGQSPVPALKAWCEYLGLAAGPPRLPLVPLEPDARNELFSALSALRPDPDAAP